jgi:hypothetical protein
MHFFNRRVFHVFLTLFFLLPTVSCSNSQQSAQNKIDKIAKDIKPELPKMLDAETKLVNVYTKKLEIVSEYQLLKHRVGEADYQKNKDKIESYLKNKVCPEIKGELLNKGISTRYIYKGNEGEVFVDRLLTAADC